IEVQDGEVDSLSSAETRGVGVRVIAGGRQGYASTAAVTEDALSEALDEARSNAAVATPDDANGLPEVEEPADVGDLVREALLTTPVERKIELARALEAAARAVDPRVRGVDTAKYADAFVSAALVSTRGLERSASSTDAWAYVMPLAVAGDETQTGLGLTMGREPDELDVDAAGRDGAQRALRLLGATKPQSRRLPIVLDPYAAASFLGVLAAALSAEAVMKGRSLFAERMGDTGAAAVGDLVDDGLRPVGPATAPWDAEGVPQQRTSVIGGGVLRSYLHDTWSARRSGDGARSTGNASRAGFKSSPGIAPTNLYLEPGVLEVEAVLRDAGEALYVQDVVGLHSGANPVSGDVSVGVTGLMVRDGAFAEPVREATVATTLVDLLRGVVAVGADLRFFPFGGALGGSTVLVEQMTVAGR
ncbi:MAG TPA: TldD/PmbA family protein, partial [Solirubrobacteraceae bacterium]|nr:TldD/PmbA family protein [Solirubrobacteraceae bacterium]